tara:strand:+ start:66 stop:1058 length:993 start_codon:yes stop_codon:yes gene_type:complete
MTKNIMITGGCGFIGHHLVEYVLDNTDWNVIVIDKLSYASRGLDRLRENNSLENKRVRVFPIDFTLSFSDGVRREIGNNVNIIAHLGAETHVDNSIKFPKECFHNNITGTVELLEYARGLKNLETFFYFSTDEVFGPAPENIAFKEWDRHKPTNPYSSSKSSAESICLAYSNTYNLPLMIVNNMNVFGERQHSEKFIPGTMKKILSREKILIHSDKTKTQPGSRFYIYAKNVCASLVFLLENGTHGEKYHVVGEREVDNLELATLIAKYMNKDFEYELVDFHSNRPGHDLRYAIEDLNLNNLGWVNPLNFEESLRKTVEWTMQNKNWLNF